MIQTQPGKLLQTTPLQINTVAEYEYIKSRGFEPLTDIFLFILPIRLRVDIQRQLFGEFQLNTGDVVSANQRFYHWVWEHKPHFCEETTQPLYHYSAVHVSHIISRGARPDMAHDPRNVNILTFDAHSTWESSQRQRMRIYPYNKYIINLLKNEYSAL